MTDPSKEDEARMEKPDEPSRDFVDLLARLANNDAAAWRHWFDAHYQTLICIAKRAGANDATAEDAVSNALVTIFNLIVNRGWLTAPPDKPWAYIRKVVRNEVIALWRKQRRLGLLDPSYDVEDGETKDVVDSLIRQENFARLRGAVEALGDPYRQAILYHYYYDPPWKLQKIADTMGASIESVKTWLFRARQKLGDDFGADDQ